MMEKLLIKDDFIKLGQALKLCGIAQSGVDAKMMIINGEVKYNGQVETQRGKKLYEGDTFEADGRVFQVVK